MTSFTDIPRKHIYRFVGENPMAWIIPDHHPASALLMPLLFEDSACDSIIGHVPRRVASTGAFKSAKEVVCLFLGPHSYIPPEWAGKRDWVPTWNFVSLKVVGNIELSEHITKPAVEFLVDHMQRDSKSNWSMANVEHRLPSLLRRIVGFRISVSGLLPRFKVGQDEDIDTYVRIEEHLEGNPIATWMRR